jgi:2,3,4,5-tetrahydropyridine-2-carboxylate N-succinyltransferase
VDITTWKETLTGLAALPPTDARVREAFMAFRNALERGELRAASLNSQGAWEVHTEVKEGVLLGFRLGVLAETQAGTLSFVDKDTYPARAFTRKDGVRVVPGGSSVRSGAYVAPGVVIMPPAYINVGAYVDEGTMVDSHALVGSCAQVGKRVHLSAGCQVGGVLEPIGALPVVIEDDAFVGGNTGVYEGVQLGARSVLGSGVVLNASSVVFDLVREQTYRAKDGVLRIPPDAVLVPGSRPASGAFAQRYGLQLSAPLVVKYRDSKTSARAALEDALR